MEAARPAAALDQRHYGFLWRRSRISAVLGFATRKGLVALDELAFATKRLWIDLAHCLADTMRHKPRGLVGNAEGAMQLMCREPLFAGRHQAIGQNPFVERNVAALHDGSDRHRESLIACVAMEQSRPVRLAIEPVDPLCLSAVRAVWAIGPADLF